MYRLPGDPHGPLLRRADRHHGVPGDGQRRAPTPRTRSPCTRTRWAWWCARSREPSNWRSKETLDAYLRAPRRRGHRGPRHPAAGAAPAHARRADGRHLQRGALDGGPGGARDARRPAWRAWTWPPASPRRQPYVLTTPSPDVFSGHAAARAGAPLRRGGLRLRPQALHAPVPRGRGLPRDGGARQHHGRGGARAQAARRVPRQRPRRSGRGDGRGQDGGDAAGQGARVRHLPGAPDPRARAGRPDVQDEVRPPRRQPAGEGSDHGQGGDHRAEPRLRGGRRQPEGQGAW